MKRLIFHPGRKVRIAAKIAADIVIIAVTYYFAFILRFLDVGIAGVWLEKVYLRTLPVVVFSYLIPFVFFGLHRGFWRYSSVHDVVQLFKAVIIGFLLSIAGIIYLLGIREFPRSIFPIHAMLCFFTLGGVRLSTRLIRETISGRITGESKRKRAIIIGAGNASENLVRELLRDPTSQYEPIALVDDDPAKQGREIHGVRVAGTIDDLPRISQELAPDELIMAVPSATRHEIKRIMDLCHATGKQFKTTPSLMDIVSERVSVTHIREVEPGDLLGREKVDLSVEKIAGYVNDATILVTGAGGTIGSELCAQLGCFGPARLIMLGRGEFSIHKAERRLRSQLENTELLPVIADIRDKNRLKRIMKEYKPIVIFHAAAHKHVGLMELCPDEAVLNNVYGTRNLIEASKESGVRRFVMISTDKAVNPTSFMGATKRICELIVEAEAQLNDSDMTFSSVRFGNVLESRGSVVPIFRDQIAAGGPVTVTDPEVSRFFMTTSEAAQLVIQAGGMAKGGEIFVLDMGEPVKIIDLARDLIRLYGYEPERDIEIKFIGLAPGEKLHEEPLSGGKGTHSTEHPKILLAEPDKVNAKKLSEQLEELHRVAGHGKPAEIARKIKEIVPEFQHRLLE